MGVSQRHRGTAKNIPSTMCGGSIMILTAWFPTTAMPARPGVYLVRLRHCSEEGYAYHNGFRWGFMYKTVNDAYELDPIFTHAQQGKQWRGCTSEQI
jgi:hypothetical protein